MTDLHPNWQATDADGDPVPVRAPAPEAPAPEPDAPDAVQPMTRQPAAIAGILLVISLGMALYYGRSVLIGATAPGTITIRIQDTGFLPQSARLAQGDTVTWVNETARTQALASDELCTTERACLSTGTIAPGGSASRTITADFSAGTYRYYGIAAQGTEGILIVTASPRAAQRLGAQANLETALPLDAGTGSTSSAVSSVSSSSSTVPEDPEAAVPAGSAPPPPPPTDGSISLFTEEDIPSDTTPPPPPPPSAGGTTGNITVRLPTNPYAVGSGQPTVPVPAPTGSLFGGTPLPISQPATGPGLWFAGLTALSLLFLFSRRHHRIQRLYK
ncbi:MAG: hypothetical protein PHS73_03285 [Candidatus Peribacteraceae bacterium]|nr:hypothetical protein [Candidatus Peribacteraceae bacterium]